MAVSHTISTETTITYHDRNAGQSRDFNFKIQNLAMYIGAYVLKYSPESLNQEQQLNFKGFMAQNERNLMIEWTNLSADQKNPEDFANVVRQYTITAAKVSALMRFINNSNFFIVMSNEFCARDGDGIPYLVQAVTIESTDTAVSTISQQKLKALMLTSQTSSIKIGAISQYAWFCLSEYIKEAAAQAPRGGHVPANVPRSNCLIS